MSWLIYIEELLDVQKLISGDLKVIEVEFAKYYVSIFIFMFKFIGLRLNIVIRNFLMLCVCQIIRFDIFVEINYVV